MPNPSAWIWVDGDIVDAASAIWSASDRAPLYGDGLFETLRVAGGRIMDLEPHLERFEASALALGFADVPALVVRARTAAREIIEHDRRQEGVLRITWSRAGGSRGFAPAADGAARVVAQTFELSLGVAARRDGVRARFYGDLVQGTLACHKSCSSLVLVEAARRAQERGVDVGLLSDGRGGIGEASSANLFAVIGGVVVTPPLSLPILPGITRAWVLAQTLTGATGTHPSREQALSVESLATADEAFLTNSIQGIVPLVEIDGIAIADGVPGVVTRLLQSRMENRWKSLVQDEIRQTR